MMCKMRKILVGALCATMLIGTPIIGYAATGVTSLTVNFSNVKKLIVDYNYESPGGQMKLVVNSQEYHPEVKKHEERTTTKYANGSVTQIYFTQASYEGYNYNWAEATGYHNGSYVAYAKSGTYVE